ncbi:MAG: hypothetical protein ABOK23_11240 [Candidatus Methanoperedens sp.]|nr:hypothetical protein [Candidatus Methanoperedens sp.]MCZ7395120.1 hypothetical protein [Candidatus Methanoperedens sp.]
MFELKKTRTDLDMITNLYSRLFDRLIPGEELEAQDLKAIRNKDKIDSTIKGISGMTSGNKYQRREYTVSCRHSWRLVLQGGGSRQNESVCISSFSEINLR